MLVVTLVLALSLAPATAFADIESTDAGISPGTIRSGETALVTLSMAGSECQLEGNNADVALVIDRSGSMNDNNKINAAVDAALGFVDRMNFPGDQGAVISFNPSARIDAPLGNERAPLESALNGLRQAATDGTSIGSGIVAAVEELINRRVNDISAMIVLSDGRDDPFDPGLLDKAQSACNAGIQIFTIGLGDDVDETVLQDLTCNGGFYSRAPSPTELDGIYQSIADVVLGAVATNVSITDTIPSDISIISGSLSENGIETDNTVNWKFNQIQADTQVSYAVTAHNPGVYTIGPASATYTDCAGEVQEVTFPPLTLVVEATPARLPVTGSPYLMLFLRNAVLPTLAIFGFGLRLVLPILWRRRA